MSDRLATALLVAFLAVFCVDKVYVTIHRARNPLPDKPRDNLEDLQLAPEGPQLLRGDFEPEPGSGMRRCRLGHYSHIATNPRGCPRCRWIEGEGR